MRWVTFVEPLGTTTSSQVLELVFPRFNTILVDKLTHATVAVVSKWPSRAATTASACFCADLIRKDKYAAAIAANVIAPIANLMLILKRGISEFVLLCQVFATYAKSSKPVNVETNGATSDSGAFNQSKRSQFKKRICVYLWPIITMNNSHNDDTPHGTRTGFASV